MNTYTPRSADCAVPCPVCERPVDCWIDPGERASRSGSPESWHPGTPPELEDFDGDCECGVSPLVRQAAYRDALEDRALNAMREVV